jgi:hypothetical protein
MTLSRQQLEYRIQAAIIRYYRGQRLQGNKKYPVTRPFPDLLCWHCQNQGMQDGESRGYFLHEMGLMAGAWDLTCIWMPKILRGADWVSGKGIIEVKGPDGKLSTAQEKFRDSFIRRGGVAAEVRSVAEFRDAVIGWGVECHNTSVQEADLRTWDEKRDMATAFYGPIPTA